MSYASKPSSCMGCPLYERGLSYVPGLGSPQARVALLGQGPGKIEAAHSQPFVGPSGDMLGRWLAASGHSRSELWIDNAIRCWLRTGKADAVPPAKAVAHCRQAHWEPALRALPNLKVVVACGVPAMRTLLGPKASARWAGAVFDLSRSELFPLEASPNE